MDWYRSESWLAYERPLSEVTGNKADNYERRAPGTAGMREGVRYQIYESSDGHVLFMASERAFWKNFCNGVGRPELFEKWPGSKFADHARGNRELQRELRDVFKSKSSADWIEFGSEHNTPIAPVLEDQSSGPREFNVLTRSIGLRLLGGSLVSFRAIAGTSSVFLSQRSKDFQDVGLHPRLSHAVDILPCVDISLESGEVAKRWFGFLVVVRIGLKNRCFIRN